MINYVLNYPNESFKQISALIMAASTQALYPGIYRNVNAQIMDVQ